MNGFEQQIRIEPFANAPLSQLLGLPAPIFAADDPYRQLRYVEKYARDLDCKCVVIEQHYIDRDYMEDHSVFYAQSLASLPNFCRRVNFFRSAPELVRREFRRIRTISDPLKFRNESDAFSRQEYLGFAVIKPLNGCPVGRTVLHTFPEKPKKEYERKFQCACDYSVHLLGLPLKIRGLAFQQQDLGVSACATTALWSALQRTRAMEDRGAASPAHITIRASQSGLPFGRPMPSEGLSLDQMCQAVQSLGYAPNLIRADKLDETRGVLYSAINSGVSPVLILSKGSDQWHAVAVAGMKVNMTHEPFILTGGFDDLASDLLALYVHDDRLGPYLCADLEARAGRPQLKISLRESARGETWRLSHILVPVHNKIRLSFGELRRLSFRLAGDIGACLKTLGSTGVTTSVESSILKSHVYIEGKSPATIESQSAQSRNYARPYHWHGTSASSD